eukprot:CAMPEP_0183321436 /NCGR_PEP_ID=MMETSP0160_2-20130417/68887_1 /TAXON_ID=2839 ORGANISM="Odontella Sinensis, Strain Grunow 1884" /NCGR_SAMPLE_ID=MMETSP0160_2 /ASSEMBLY_ACC=CAM_ASM_000250 /LENGTH=186 /DNA_ID=CAMNT_0025488379 /DNA_START=70 /DNA_END=628 /DNA_ORIENTATION=-
MKKVLAASAAGAATALTVAYFPRPPQLNLCSTEVDWKYILSGMVAANMQASFEILVSVYNPNPYSVYLDDVSGSFIHDNMEFGTFSMDPTLIDSQAITDDLVSVTFNPGEWEAFVMITEYYAGALNFTVDAHLGSTFPQLFNTSLDVSIDNILIDVSGATSASSNEGNAEDISVSAIMITTDPVYY